jgi:hypothetical protein
MVVHGTCNGHMVRGEFDMNLEDALLHYQERMIDEYQKAQILDRLDGEVANTAQINQVLTDVSSILGGVESDVARLAAVADQALPAIVEHLALNADRLGGIEQMLANPTETASAEFYRRGSFALASGWVEEAVADLSKAVDTYPYHPKSWFNLGPALERQGSSEAAAEALLRCARYCVAQSKPLAATASLVSAGLYRLIGQPDEALDALRRFLPELNRCAELRLAFAVHHGELSHLSAALELMPMLAADARAAGVPTVEVVAADLCRHADGPVTRLRQLEQAVQALADAGEMEGLKGFTRPSSVSLPDAGVDALLLAEVSLTRIVADAWRIDGEVRQELDGLATAERQAAAHVDACEHEVTRQATESANNVAAQAALIETKAAQARQEVVRLYEPLVTARRKMWNLAWEEKEDIREADYLANIVKFWEAEDTSSTSYSDDDSLLIKYRGKLAAAREKMIRLRQLGEQAPGQVNEAEECLLHALAQTATEPWLQAAQDAEAACQNALQSRWEYAKARDHLRTAEEMLERFEEASRQYPESEDNWPTPSERRRLVALIEYARAEVEPARAAMNLTLSEDDQADQMARQMGGEARRAAEREAERANGPAERHAQESYKQAQRAAQDASEAARRSNAAMAMPLRMLATAIAVACASRPRIVAFTHSVSLGTTPGMNSD